MLQETIIILLYFCEKDCIQIFWDLTNQSSSGI